MPRNTRQISRGAGTRGWSMDPGKTPNNWARCLAPKKNPMRDRSRIFCIDRSRLSAEVSTACPQPLWRSGIWGGEGNISIDSRRGFPLSWRLPAEFPARWPPPPRPTAWTVASGPNTLLRACEEALDAGATPEEILHALILLTSTIGFPTVVAGLTWVGDILEGKRG